MSTPLHATPAQVRALRAAFRRPGGPILPLPPSNATAERALLAALVRKGWASGDAIPIITAAGEKVAAHGGIPT